MDQSGSTRRSAELAHTEKLGLERPFATRDKLLQNATDAHSNYRPACRIGLLVCMVLVELPYNPRPLARRGHQVESPGVWTRRARLRRYDGGVIQHIRRVLRLGLTS
jgi:hypothetical protein